MLDRLHACPEIAEILLLFFFYKTRQYNQEGKGGGYIAVVSCLGNFPKWPWLLVPRSLEQLFQLFFGLTVIDIKKGPFIFFAKTEKLVKMPLPLYILTRLKSRYSTLPNKHTSGRLLRQKPWSMFCEYF